MSFLQRSRDDSARLRQGGGGVNIVYYPVQLFQISIFPDFLLQVQGGLAKPCLQVFADRFSLALTFRSFSARSDNPSSI